MLHLRLIYGSLLAVLVIAAMVLDGALSALPSSRGYAAELSPARWLTNGLLCTLLVATLTALTVRELLCLAQQAGYRPLRGESYVFALGLVVGPYVSYNARVEQAVYDESWGMLWLALALAVAFLAQAVRRGTERVLVNLATTLFIIFYAGGLFGFMTKLRMEVGGPAGAALLVFSMFVVKMNDVGGYFAGLLFGRRKAIPWLSPKKTWEGYLGGLIAAAASSVLFGLWLARAGLVPPGAAALAGMSGLLAFGVLMALFSIAGDLAESLLKRDVAVKDSGAAIPGMGGFLDVVDSTLLAAPVAWFFWTRLAPALG